MDDRIREYERLRHLAHELDVQAETVDRRLVEIEHQLPEAYTFPGDDLEKVDAVYQQVIAIDEYTSHAEQAKKRLSSLSHEIFRHRGLGGGLRPTP